MFTSPRHKNSIKKQQAGIETKKPFLFIFVFFIKLFFLSAVYHRGNCHLDVSVGALGSEDVLFKTGNRNAGTAAATETGK